MNQAHEFGLALRQARERRGIAVEEVACRTKVAAPLFAGLECGDLSRWPAGIFRRAFVRGYAEAIGLDPEGVLADFLRVYPEDGVRDSARTCGLVPHPDSSAGGEHDGLRLTLAGGRAWQPSGRRVAGVAIDVVAASAICAAVLWGGASWEASAALLTAGAVVCYYVAAHLAWGTSLGVRLASRAGALQGRTAQVREPLGLASVEPTLPRVPPADVRVQRLRDRRRASRAERTSSRPTRH